MPGEFEVLGVFELSGRGLVAFGNVIDGTVKMGELARLSSEEEQPDWYEILAVEMLDRTRTESYVSLVFSPSGDLISRFENRRFPVTASVRAR